MNNKIQTSKEATASLAGNKALLELFKRYEREELLQQLREISIVCSLEKNQHKNKYAKREGITLILMLRDVFLEMNEHHAH